jgi:uncharacterized protein (DUF952 family)
VILHITTAADWERAERDGEYRAATLHSEGFMHASTREQVLFVANDRFRGHNDLVLLVIEPGRLRSDLLWELSEPDFPPFPHVYGPVNLDAVCEVLAFPEGPDGFDLPPGL